MGLLKAVVGPYSLRNVKIKLCRLKSTNYLGSWLGEVETCEELLFVESIEGATSSLRYQVVAAKFKDVACPTQVLSLLIRVES